MYQNLTWETVERGHNPRAKLVFVSVRHNTLLINSGFFKQIHGVAKGYRYVRVRRNNEHWMLLLEFLTPQARQKLLEINQFTDGIHELVVDGGSQRKLAKSTSFIIGCGRLIERTPWLKAISQETASKKRRFVPEETGAEGSYVVKFMPSFENEAESHFCELPDDLKGIYCYVAANGEILYIGQGNIKQRFKHHKAQKDIPATYFRWTAVEDERDRLRAETHHLNAFMAKFGRLPAYNRIAGQIVS